MRARGPGRRAGARHVAPGRAAAVARPPRGRDRRAGVRFLRGRRRRRPRHGPHRRACCRAANSAASGSKSRIENVHDAVVRLGAARTLAAAMLTVVGARLHEPHVPYHLDAGELWQHSCATSIAGDLVRNLAGVPLPASLGTTGLLHDIGKLVLDAVLTERADTLDLGRRARRRPVRGRARCVRHRPRRSRGDGRGLLGAPARDRRGDPRSSRTRATIWSRWPSRWRTRSRTLPSTNGSPTSCRCCASPVSSAYTPNSCPRSSSRRRRTSRRSSNSTDRAGEQ